MPEMNKKGKQAVAGIFVHKRVDPECITQYFAEVATLDYLHFLQDTGKLDQGIAEHHSGILFKHPTIQKGSQVRDGGFTSFPGPGDYIKDKVGSAQAPLTQSQSLLFFKYTLCLVKLDGFGFDNRVFSDHDRFIKTEYDDPDPVEMTWGNLSLVWHVHW